LREEFELDGKTTPELYDQYLLTLKK